MACFPAVLYEVVDGSEDERVVAWCEKGAAFIVRDLARFCGEVLPKHYGHASWHRFALELEAHGFKKMTQGQKGKYFVREGLVFSHSDFQRGQPERAATAFSTSTPSKETPKVIATDTTPSMISDQVLMRELDALVQQIKLHHDKIVAKASTSKTATRVQAALGQGGWCNFCCCCFR